jgi:DHA2 family multidrug resistance protein
VFFASILLVPLWLQTNMGYTASWAGYTTALGGIMAVVMSPIVPRLMRRIDARALVSFGVASLAVIALWRSHFASNASYWTIAVTFLIQGISMPFFFIPTTQISLSSVLPSETASAAGLQNFLRTLSAAFCGALTTTMWDSAASRNHVNIAGSLNDPQGVQNTFTQMGMTPAQALGQIENLTQNQAVMLATDQMFLIMTVAFVIAAGAVWLAPKPNIFAGQAAGGH